MGAGFIAATLFQIPSGFLADFWGQKNVIIITKILVLLSSIFFAFGTTFLSFILGAICMSLGVNAFSGLTLSFFLKVTLEKLGRGEEYRYISSHMIGKVSLISSIFIIGLPLLTAFDIRLPLYCMIGIDTLGLILAFTLFPVHTKIEKIEKKQLFPLMRELSQTRFFGYALFSAGIVGFLMADSLFRSVYLTELGYPLTFIGMVAGVSRIIWWIVGRSIRTIERYISFDRPISIEIFLFPLYYITASSLSNPWLLGALISIVLGWFWGRNEIYTDHMMNHIPDPKYRATALSIKMQIENILQTVIIFGITGIMAISYSLGFFVLGITLFLYLLTIDYFFFHRYS